MADGADVVAGSSERTVFFEGTLSLRGFRQTRDALRPLKNLPPRLSIARLSVEITPPWRRTADPTSPSQDMRYESQEVRSIRTGSDINPYRLGADYRKIKKSHLARRPRSPPVTELLGLCPFYFATRSLHPISPPPTPTPTQPIAAAQSVPALLYSFAFPGSSLRKIAFVLHCSILRDASLKS